MDEWVPDCISYCLRIKLDRAATVRSPVNFTGEAKEVYVTVT